MKDDNELFKKIDQLITGGYSVNKGDVIEVVLYGIVANSLIMAKVLEKQLRLERLVNDGILLNEDEIKEDAVRLLAAIKEEAEAMKDSILADMHISGSNPPGG